MNPVEPADPEPASEIIKIYDSLTEEGQKKMYIFFETYAIDGGDEQSFERGLSALRVSLKNERRTEGI